MSEIDDDLKELLDQLDDDGIKVEPESNNLIGQNIEVEQQILDNSQESTNEPEQPSDQDESSELDNKVSALRPIEDNRRFDGEHHFKAEMVDEEPVVDIARYLDKMEGVADEVLQACRSDRQEAQEVINMLRTQCDQAHSKSQPPARMYVDGLVKSVEVKANINTNAVKVMEGVAKMIAATRAGLNINNNNVSVSTAELDEILSSTEISGDLD
jgi:hypothetical protein